ncbi:MAG: ATP-binding protein [Myxococcota bacterium]
MRFFGLGLRGQIIIALTVAFVVSFTLLGLASVQLGQRARILDRRAGGQSVAATLAAALDETDADPMETVANLSTGAIGEGGVHGVEVDFEGLEPYGRGRVGVGDVARAPLARGGEVRVWLAPIESASAQPQTNLFLFYVALTGGVILILAYVSLTYLIVRPVSLVTRASERLAGGAEQVQVPVRGAGEVARLAVAFNAMASQLRDDRDKLEQRLRELERTTRELETAQAQVLRNEKLASVGRLAAGVAHEIGNPLSAILGLVELVREGDLDEDERAEFLRRIQQETERINRIIRELLDYSRRDPDEGEGQADVTEALDDALRLLGPQKIMREVRVEREGLDAPVRAKISLDKLTQVFLNLLINAADAMKGDGTIAIRVRTDKSDIIIHVDDDGPGIDADVLPHIFEPFVTTKPPGEGTGLGLAVSHSILDAAGGELSVANRNDGGASFRLRLPATS